MPLFSLIVPVYNTSKWLSRALKSIDAQVFLNFEIIFVDDASDDSSPEMLDAYCKTHTNARVIHKQATGGLSAARNTGIENANGTYLAFLDSDDWVEPTFLETFARLIEQTSCDVAHVDSASCSSEAAFAQPQTEIVTVESGVAACARMLEVEEYAVWSRAYKASLFSAWQQANSAPVFPVGLTCEDRVANVRLLPGAVKVATSNRLEYHYFMNMASISNGGLTRRAMELLQADALMLECAKETSNEKIIKLAQARKAKGPFSLLVKWARFGFCDSTIADAERTEILSKLRASYNSNYKTMLTAPLPAAKRIVAWQLRYVPQVAIAALRAQGQACAKKSKQ